MKKQLLIITFIVSALLGQALDYYWIGGSGNWSDINNWATTSGGSVLRSVVPSQNDDVFFDANSGFTTSSRIVTVDVIANCHNMTWNGALNTPTIMGSPLNIYGSMTLQSGMAYNVNTTWFKSTSLGETITTNGTIVNGGFNTQGIRFDGQGGEWTLQDDFTTSATTTIFLNQGTLNTNNKTLDIGGLSSGLSINGSSNLPLIANLNLGSSHITYREYQCAWNYTGTGVNLNAGTSHIVVNTANGTRFTGQAGHTYHRISAIPDITNARFDVNGVYIHAAYFYNNVNFGGSAKFDTLVFSAGKTYAFQSNTTQTITTAFTATAASCTGLIQINSQTAATQANLFFQTGANSFINNVIIKDIKATGAITPITASSSFDLGNNNGFTFTAPTSTNLYWVGGAGAWNDQSHWSFTSGGAGGACIPTPVDNVFFDGASGFITASRTVSLTGVGHYCHNMTWNGALNTPTIMGSPLNIYGSMTLQSGMAYNVNTTWFKSTSLGETITTNGTIVNGGFNTQGIRFDGQGGEWTLQDDFTTSATTTIFLNQGTLNTNNKTLDIGGLSSGLSINGSSNLPLIANLNLGSSHITYREYQCAWNYTGTGVNLNAGTSHIVVNTANGTRFTGQAGHTYHRISAIPDITNARFDVNGVYIHAAYFYNNVNFGGSAKFDTLVFSAGKTYNLQAGTTQTVTTAFYTSGNPCFITYLKSSVAGTRANINVQAGFVNYDYTNVIDINATSSYAPLQMAGHSTDAGNNLNISFAPTVTTGIVGLGPDRVVACNAFPFTLNTNDFYPNPTTAFTWYNASTSNSVAVADSGKYFISVNYGAGCVVKDTVNISKPAGLPVTVFASNTVICSGVSTILNASGSSSYVWSTGANTASTSVSPSASMIYSVTGTDVNSCIDTKTISITVNITPTVAISSVSSPAICSGNTSTITPSGANTYTLTSAMQTLTSAPFVVNPTGTTTYTLRGTSSSNCPSNNSLQQTITVNTTPTVAISTVSSPTICSGNTSTITPSGANTYTLTSATQTLTTAPFVVNPTATTTYTLNGTSLAACPSNNNVQQTITVNTLPTVAVSSVSSPTICSGNTSTITPSGANTYTLTSATQTLTTVPFVVNPTTTTTYTLRGTSSSNCPSNNSVQQTITVNTTPTVAISTVINSTICSGNTSTITPSGASTYTLTSATQTLTTAPFVVNPTSNTTYTLNGTSSSNCPSNNSVQQTITVNTTPTVAISTVSSPTICLGNTSTITPSGANTYTLTSATQTLTASSFVVNPTATTTYTLRGTSSSNCPSNNNVQQTITVNTTPTVAVSSVSSPTICIGNTSTITPSGASAYTLTSATQTLTTAPFVVNPTSSTTYTLNGTSSSNCPSNNNVQQTITVNTLPTVAVSSVSSPTICSGNTSTITPSGASTYTLTSATQTLTTAPFVVNPTSSTTYTLNGTSSSNCPSNNSLQQTITVNTTPTVAISTVSSPTICLGNTSTITPSGANTYTLTSGTLTLTTAPFVVSPTGTTTYTLNGTSSLNCSSNNSVQQVITVNTLPNLSVSSQTNVTCFGLTNGGVTLLPSGGSGSGYTISPTSTSNLSFGTYTYTLVDGNSCSTSTVVSISQPTASLTSAISGTTANTSCTSANGTASVTLTGGTPSYTVNWDNGLTGDIISNLNTGIHTYTITDANGCTDNTGSVTIQGVTGITTNAVSQTSVSCFEETTGALSYTTNGGTTHTYTLTGTSTSYTNTTGVFTNLIADTYTLVAMDDVSGCVDSKITTVSSPSSSITLTGITTTTALCNGGLGVVTATVSGGTPGYNYNWSSNTSSVNSATYTAGVYSLTVTDLNNCSLGTQTFVISEPALLTVSVTNTTQSGCGLSNGGATVTVTGGIPIYTYFWTNTSTSYITSTGTTNSLSVGSNSVSIVDGNGCSTTTVVTITSHNAPVVTTTVTDVACYGDATGSIVTNVSGSNVYTYTWSNGLQTAAITNIPSGIYTLTVKDGNNCLTQQTLTVEQPNTPLSVVLSNSTQAVCGKNNGSISAEAIGGTPVYQYAWNTGTLNSNIINDIQEGDYTLIVTDLNGCKDTLSITLRCKLDLVIPEVFTPNGDGKNDKFEIKAIGDYPNTSIQIFNRWGSLVYMQSNYNNEWDGKPNVGDASGKNTLPAGTYFVVIDFGDDKTEPYKGYVMLEY